MQLLLSLPEPLPDEGLPVDQEFFFSAVANFSLKEPSDFWAFLSMIAGSLFYNTKPLKVTFVVNWCFIVKMFFFSFLF